MSKELEFKKEFLGLLNVEQEKEAKIIKNLNIILGRELYLPNPIIIVKNKLYEIEKTFNDANMPYYSSVIHNILSIYFLKQIEKNYDSMNNLIDKINKFKVGIIANINKKIVYKMIEKEVLEYEKTCDLISSFELSDIRPAINFYLNTALLEPSTYLLTFFNIKSILDKLGIKVNLIEELKLATEKENIATKKFADEIKEMATEIKNGK